MERRVEPRFAVASHVALFPVDKLDLEIEGKIREISAGGMRVQVSHAVRIGARILLDSEHHLVIVEGRPAELSGNGFLIGVQRVGSASKLDFPADATRAEQVRRLMAGIDGTESPSEDEVPPEAVLFPLPPNPAVPEPSSPLPVRAMSAMPSLVMPKSAMAQPLTLLEVPLSESLAPETPEPEVHLPPEHSAPTQQPASKRFPIWYAVAAGLAVALALTAAFLPWQSPAKPAVHRMPAPAP